MIAKICLCRVFKNVCVNRHFLRFRNCKGEHPFCTITVLLCLCFIEGRSVQGSFVLIFWMLQRGRVCFMVNSQNYSYEYEYDKQYGTVSDGFVADAAVAERVSFIRRTYSHLFGAILIFAGLLSLFMVTPPIRQFMMGMTFSGYYWVPFLLYVGVTMLAQRLAHSGASPAVQYGGFGLYIVAEALIFVPLLLIATHFGGPNIIPTAAFLTLLIFGGLTAIVFITKQDFSFLRMGLTIASFGALGLIVASFFLGFSLGIFFTVAMIVLLSGYILYDTSNILHHYQTDQHVAASLALFASVATLFWYVIRLLMIFGGDD